LLILADIGQVWLQKIFETLDTRHRHSPLDV
jgi:hypothetical protein